MLELTPIPTGKIYKSKALTWGTLLGGPMVAGYLISANYQVLNEPAKARKALLISLLVSAALFGGLFLIPNAEKVPGYLVPGVCAGITSVLVGRYQTRQIEEHINAGGETYSGWRVLWISLAIALMTLVVVVAIAMTVDAVSSFGLHQDMNAP